MSIAILLFYGVVVGTALWLSWKDEDLQFLGLALLTSFVFSNIVWWTAPAASRTGVYSALELLVVGAAWMAWRQRREWGLAGVVVVALCSIGTNIAFASLPSHSVGQVRLYEMLTNGAFLIECVLCAWIGGMDGVRTGRFDYLFRLGGRGSQSHARSSEEG